MTQSQRSVSASGTRRGRVRSTASFGRHSRLWPYRVPGSVWWSSALT